jgi:hypothetical protein
MPSDELQQRTTASRSELRSAVLPEQASCEGELRWHRRPSSLARLFFKVVPTVSIGKRTNLRLPGDRQFCSTS